MEKEKLKEANKFFYDIIENLDMEQIKEIREKLNNYIYQKENPINYELETL